jgi:hypothetical protein
LSITTERSQDFMVPDHGSFLRKYVRILRVALSPHGHMHSLLSTLLISLGRMMHVQAGEPKATPGFASVCFLAYQQATSMYFDPIKDHHVSSFWVFARLLAKRLGVRLIAVTPDSQSLWRYISIHRLHAAPSSNPSGSTALHLSCDETPVSVTRHLAHILQRCIFG